MSRIEHGADANVSELDAVEKFKSDPDWAETVEVEGGITWAQTYVIGYTGGLLHLPKEGVHVITDPDRRRVRLDTHRRTVEEISKMLGQEKITALGLIQTATRICAEEYRLLADRKPEWGPEAEMARMSRDIWTNIGHPAITEETASYVLHHINYNQTPPDA